MKNLRNSRFFRWLYVAKLSLVMVGANIANVWSRFDLSQSWHEASISCLTTQWVRLSAH